jgi:hypothetical protein
VDQAWWRSARGIAAHRREGGRWHNGVASGWGIWRAGERDYAAGGRAGDPRPGTIPGAGSRLSQCRPGRQSFMTTRLGPARVALARSCRMSRGVIECGRGAWRAVASRRRRRQRVGSRPVGTDAGLAGGDDHGVRCGERGPWRQRASDARPPSRTRAAAGARGDAGRRRCVHRPAGCAVLGRRDSSVQISVLRRSGSGRGRVLLIRGGCQRSSPRILRHVRRLPHASAAGRAA